MPSGAMEAYFVMLYTSGSSALYNVQVAVGLNGKIYIRWTYDNNGTLGWYGWQRLATTSDLYDKQDKLIAGDNITISGNTISANVLTKEDPCVFTCRGGFIGNGAKRYSMRAFGDVVAAGWRSFSVYMALTSDNKVVASSGSFTDDNGVTHTVSAETLEALQQVNYDGAPVPSLSDCMEFAKKNGLEIVLSNVASITEEAVPYIAESIAKYGMWERVVVPVAVDSNIVARWKDWFSGCKTNIVVTNSNQ